MTKTILTIHLFANLLFFAVTIISCKKKDTTAGTLPPVNNPLPVSAAKGTGIAPFSGTWTGTIKVDDIHPNLCYYTSDPITFKQEWSINTDSSVNIIEILLDASGTSQWDQTWTGRLYNQDSILITMTRTIDCFGVPKIMNTQLRTKIVKGQDNKYTITSKVDYPMCPPDCLFSFNYLINKQD